MTVKKTKRRHGAKKHGLGKKKSAWKKEQIKAKGER